MTAPKRVRQSAGILLYRRTPDGGVEVLLAHPGGPFFVRKDAGVWTIPKGEYAGEEPPETAAAREFEEEIGLPLPEADWIDLGEIRQASGKRVRAFAVAGDVDPSASRSNLFEMEWPPSSGRFEWFPEVDRAEWFSPEEAARRLNPSQAPLVERLLEALMPA